MTFRRGLEVIGTATTAPYEASWTPGSEHAGTAQSITATVTDNNGHASTAAIAVRVASPPQPPPQQQPPPQTVIRLLPGDEIRHDFLDGVAVTER